MNWFARYGIPALTFILLCCRASDSLYPCKMENIDMRALAAFAASFLPVGYIISAFGLWLYLFFNFFGMHRRAAKKCGIISIDGKSLASVTESELEVLGCLHAAKEKKDELDAYKFIQEWIRKRMDVITINHSIQIATILVVILTFPLGLSLWGSDWQPKWWLIGLLVAIFVFIYVVTILADFILVRQITNIISRYWKKSGFEYSTETKANGEGGDSPLAVILKTFVVAAVSEVGRIIWEGYKERQKNKKV